MNNPMEQRRRQGLRSLWGVSRKGILGALAALALSGVQAQEFASSWFSVDAGGGFSSGGGYALFGTVGQPDAAVPSTGGGYTLTAGFVGGLGVRQAAPLLAIDSSNAGQVRLAWEDPAGDYVLQQAPTLDPGSWTDAPGVSRSPVVLTAMESGRFYRLSRR